MYNPAPQRPNQGQSPNRPPQQQSPQQRNQPPPPSNTFQQQNPFNSNLNGPANGPTKWSGPPSNGAFNGPSSNGGNGGKGGFNGPSYGAPANFGGSSSFQQSSQHSISIASPNDIQMTNVPTSSYQNQNQKPSFQNAPFQPPPFQQPQGVQFQQPQQGQFQGQQQFDQAQNYFQELQSSATGQIGMQLGTQALSQSKQYISSNVGRYFNVVQWRYYFNVSNSYVLNKLQLLVFPFLHKGWARIVEQTDDNGNPGSYAPPRSDLNAPDLYIPVMSFITYIIITGFVTGLEKSTASTGFSPDVLGMSASSGFFFTFMDVCFVKLGNYFLNISADAPILELFAYSGYKFIPICIVQLSKRMGAWVKFGVFLYLFFAYGFFTLRSLRGLIIPDSATSGTMNAVPGAARKQRVAYLFIIVLLQTFISYLLV